MIKTKHHLIIALGYFATAALVGVILRLFLVTSVNWDYKHLLHTHSHIALLGWVYNATATLFYYLFLSNAGVDKKFKQLFYLTQIAILGMLFSFPFQGYAVFSIIFSTLFLFASYRFTFLFLKYTPLEIRERPSFFLAKASLLFLVFSSLGPWALGAIMNTLGSNSVWYHNAIYFYLHFLYNGFFTLALLALFFFLLEKHGFAMADNKFKSFTKWLIASILLTFFLSVLWSQPPQIFYSLATIGAIVQLVTFLELTRFIKQIWAELKIKLLPLSKRLFVAVGFILAVKISMQTASAFPEIAEFASHSKSLIVGYLHLVFLGLITLFIFAFLHQFKIIKINKIALWLYLFGFIISEFILFYQGLYFEFNLPPLQQYPILLLAASSFIFLGLVVLLLNFKSTNSKLKNH